MSDVIIQLLLDLLKLVMGFLDLIQFFHSLHRLVRLFDFIMNVLKILSCFDQLFAAVYLRFSGLSSFVRCCF